ncbi:hypothetical protein MPER_00126 [Moniliophthora perniciosa FA553]|nr:hypothetical protein MPER_00126 [Moniliophthora perniciosa FA553]
MFGQKWVAKRFFNTDGKETASAKDNEVQLGLEAARLQDAKDIYKEFTIFAKKQSVAIADNIKITDFRIAAEVTSSGRKPSPASGVTEDDWLGTDVLDQRIVWLLEPLRLGNVDKWSGTTQFPSHNNIIGDTLSTFAHFSIQYTHDTVVFADP